MKPLGPETVAQCSLPFVTPPVSSAPHGDHVTQARAAPRRIAAFFIHGPAARAFADSIGVPAGRLFEGRSIVGGGVRCATAARTAQPQGDLRRRLHPEKGPDVLLEALAMLADPPATLLLGDGPTRPREVSRWATAAARSFVPGPADPRRRREVAAFGTHPLLWPTLVR